MSNLRRIEKGIPILRNNLATPFLTLHHEVDRAMEELNSLFDISKSQLRKFDSLTLSPSVDFIEDDNMLKVEVEMPGMGEKDIRISIDNHTLRITGEKSTSKLDEGKSYSLREINYGHYERFINLPENLELDKAKATFKKGMLWIEFPKKLLRHSKPKTIKIEKIKE